MQRLRPSPCVQCVLITHCSSVGGGSRSCVIAKRELPRRSLLNGGVYELAGGVLALWLWSRFDLLCHCSNSGDVTGSDKRHYSTTSCTLNYTKNATINGFL